MHKTKQATLLHWASWWSCQALRVACSVNTHHEKEDPRNGYRCRGGECHGVTLWNKSVYCVMLKKPVCCKLVLHVLLLMCSLVLPVLPMLVLTAAWWLRFLYLSTLALALWPNKLWTLLRQWTVLEVVAIQVYIDDITYTYNHIYLCIIVII